MTAPELPPETIRELGHLVADFVTDYLAALETLPVASPGDTPQTLRALLEEPLPRQPQGLAAAWEDFETKIAAHSVRVGHPRFLAWMRTSPLAGAVFAEALAAALNQSVAVWQGAPAATETERTVLRWLLSLSGYTQTAEGILTSGGSMANFVGMLLARQFAFPQVRENGVRGLPAAAFYLSPETHYSVVKAIEMIGFGKASVHCVPTDHRRQMHPPSLRRAIRTDRRQGIRPVAVVATLGTTATGACDPLPELAEICAEEGIWLHVDGAYGGLTASIPSAAHCAQGLQHADSFTVDPHKTLFVPFEAGAVFTRHRGLLPATFGARTAYLPNAEDEGFHFRDYGPQLSRSFRALKIYLTLKIYGADAIMQTWERLHRLAQRFAVLISETADFQLLTPPSLGIVTFRYAPPEADPDALDALNRALITVLQRRGEAFLSLTHLGETEALRACFISYRTTEADLPRLLEAVRRAAAEVSP